MANDACPLRRFQDAFAHALLDPHAAADLAPDVAALVGQPGFDVYRNTVIKGCVAALQANYPAVARLVGDEWFRAAASIYVRANLPTHPALVRYGQGFEAFLAAFEPAAGLPYLPGVARLDRFWTEAHIARDETFAAASPLADLDVESRTRLVLEPHASARWAWFDVHPIFTIWQRNRAPGPFDDSDIEWRGEGALVLRRLGVVRWVGLDVAGWALLDACAAGCSVADAEAAVLATDPAADPATLFAQLLEAGAFARVTSHDSSIEDPLP